VIVKSASLFNSSKNVFAFTSQRKETLYPHYIIVLANLPQETKH